MKAEQKILTDTDTEKINMAMSILENARAGKTGIYMCGNGGSVAKASNFVCDFNKGGQSRADETSG